MKTIEDKYADLLINYCIDLQKGETLLIKSEAPARPLMLAVYKWAIKAGGHPVIMTDYAETERLLLAQGNSNQIRWLDPFYKTGIETFDAYIKILAPENLSTLQNISTEKKQIRQEANQTIMNTYFERLGNHSLKRNLCQYPTHAAAMKAGMSLSEYQNFVYGACCLDQSDPIKAWLKIRAEQQVMVNRLNAATSFRYVGPETDLSFSTKGRKWINSDGRNNMPSGEVFTSPVEDSVQGYIYFSFPSTYMGREVEGVRLKVENGLVYEWHADKGSDFLNQIFSLKGSRRFGEAAIGTNQYIQKTTANILFDEKIGGSIHMALGQSYIQTGGKNKSSIHWDLITNMKKDGKIYADGKLIYKNGYFVD